MPFEAFIDGLKLEVSWDDLPREIRSRFIKENPDELCYVIVEKPGSVGLEQATAKET